MPSDTTLPSPIQSIGAKGNTPPPIQWYRGERRHPPPTPFPIEMNQLNQFFLRQKMLQMQSQQLHEFDIQMVGGWAVFPSAMGGARGFPLRYGRCERGFPPVGSVQEGRWNEFLNYKSNFKFLPQNQMCSEERAMLRRINVWAYSEASINRPARRKREGGSHKTAPLSETAKQSN